MPFLPPFSTASPIGLDLEGEELIPPSKSSVTRSEVPLWSQLVFPNLTPTESGVELNCKLSVPPLPFMASGNRLSSEVLPVVAWLRLASDDPWCGGLTAGPPPTPPRPSPCRLGGDIALNHCSNCFSFAAPENYRPPLLR